MSCIMNMSEEEISTKIQKKIQNSTVSTRKRNTKLIAVLSIILFALLIFVLIVHHNDLGSMPINKQNHREVLMLKKLFGKKDKANAAHPIQDHSPTVQSSSNYLVLDELINHCVQVNEIPKNIVVMNCVDRIIFDGGQPSETDMSFSVDSLIDPSTPQNIRKDQRFGLASQTMYFMAKFMRQHGYENANHLDNNWAEREKSRAKFNVSCGQCIIYARANIVEADRELKQQIRNREDDAQKQITVEGTQKKLEDEIAKFSQIPGPKKIKLYWVAPRTGRQWKRETTLTFYMNGKDTKIIKVTDPFPNSDLFAAFCRKMQSKYNFDPDKDKYFPDVHRGTYQEHTFIMITHE
eukprot:231776_1